MKMTREQALAKLEKMHQRKLRLDEKSAHYLMAANEVHGKMNLFIAKNRDLIGDVNVTQAN